VSENGLALVCSYADDESARILSLRGIVSMARLLSATRYVVLLGVIACALGALLCFIGALAQLALVATQALSGLDTSTEIKALAVNEVFLADVSLIATALFLVAVGLYELFISKIDFPVGVTVVSLDDLKDKLLGVIVVALAVTFLAQITTWDGKTDLLSYGVSIALVVLALGVFTYVRRGSDMPEKKPEGANGAADAEALPQERASREP
jgi:uncharacterized membrane protein YqhA